MPFREAPHPSLSRHTMAESTEHSFRVLTSSLGCSGPTIAINRNGIQDLVIVAHAGRGEPPHFSLPSFLCLEHLEHSILNSSIFLPSALLPATPALFLIDTNLCAQSCFLLPCVPMYWLLVVLLCLWIVPSYDLSQGVSPSASWTFWSKSFFIAGGPSCVLCDV